MFYLKEPFTFSKEKKGVRVAYYMRKLKKSSQNTYVEREKYEGEKAISQGSLICCIVSYLNSNLEALHVSQQVISIIWIAGIRDLLEFLLGFFNVHIFYSEFLPVTPPNS